MLKNSGERSGVKLTDASFSPATLAKLQHLWGIAPNSPSGEHVTADTVFSIPAMLNAVRLISSAIARTDCWFYEQQEEGGGVLAMDHPVFPLVTYKANPYTTSYDFFACLTANGVLGDGYAWIDRRDELSFYNLDSRYVYPYQEFDERGKLVRAWYGVSTEGGQVALPADDVIHVKNVLLHTGLQGVNIPQSLRTALGIALATQTFAAHFFKNGSHTHKILNIPGWLTKEQREELVDSMSPLAGGLNNAHRLATLMGGASLESLQTQNNENQLVESRELDLITIANAAGIPASFLGGKGFTSYGSLEQDSLNFYIHYVDPWLTQIESQINAKTLTSDEVGRFYCEFDRDSLFASDPAYVAKINDQIKNEQLSWEEGRKKLNRSTKRDDQLWLRQSSTVLAIAEEPKPEEPVVEQPAAEAPADPVAEAAATSGQEVQTVPALAMNGAQVTSALDIVDRVVQGTLPKEAAASCLQIFFNLSPEQTTAILATVEPKPVEPAPAVEAPQDQAEPTAEEQPVEAEEQPEEQRSIAEKAISMTEATLDRFKTRLLRAVEKGKLDLSEHYDVIEENLAGLDAKPVIEQLDSMQEELRSVLPEQRVGVLKSWNTKHVAAQLWS